MGKGSDTEREAHDLLSRAGYAAYRPATVRFGENDVFGMFDVLAISPDDRPDRYVQVKTNQPRGIGAYFRRAWLWASDRRTVELWTKYDREGWRVDQAVSEPSEASDDGRTNGMYRTVYDERYDGRVAGHAHTDMNLGDGVVEFLRGDGT